MILLLTDFGTRDHYVAAMKGVIASRCSVAIHDLSHELAPFDVFAAAWFLRECERFWPAGSIFVCVVDPGVGTERRIVCARSRGRFFLAPDNGLLTFLDAEAIVSVENESLFLPQSSSTFHGRDRFAPVAAALANGMMLNEVGPSLDAIERLDYEPPRYGEVAIGTIVRIDRFGNAITDLDAAKIPGDMPAQIGPTSIRRHARTYEEGGDEPFLVTGSSGTIEISIRAASAAERLRLHTRQRVEMRRTV
jgi:S-adenosylmethionine hydrolase